MKNQTVRALEAAYHALQQVEMIGHTNWTHTRLGITVFVEACAWCHKEQGHSDSCSRQSALAAIVQALEGV